MNYQIKHRTNLINDKGILYMEYSCEKCNHISIIKFIGPRTYLCENCKSKFKIIISKIVFKKR